MQIKDPILLQPDFPELELYASGKVREIFDLGDALLFVATDRLSAFDVVLPDPIPEKGRVLTALSEFWFKKTGHIIENHFITPKVVGDRVGLSPLWAIISLIVGGRAAGLADGIVDLTATGRTLRDNALEIREVIGECTARLVANRVAHKLRQREIDELVERIGARA